MNISLFLTLVAVIVATAIVAAIIRSRHHEQIIVIGEPGEFEKRLSFFLVALKFLFNQAEKEGLQVADVSWNELYQQVEKATRHALAPKECRRASAIDIEINQQLRLEIASMSNTSSLKRPLMWVRERWREKYVRTKKEPFRCVSWDNA